MAFPTPQVDQTPIPPGSPGVSREDGVLGQTVSLSDPANGGVGAFFWELVGSPPSSAVTLVNPNSPTPFLTILDVYGTYLVRETHNADVATVAIAVLSPNRSWRIPAFDETLEYGATGWDDGMQTILRDLEANAFNAGGGTLDAAYDFGVPGGGRTITADANAVVITTSAADNNNVLQVTKTPAGIQAGAGVLITMGSNTTGAGLSVGQLGSGHGLLFASDTTPVRSDIRFTQATADPSSLVPGSLWYNTTANKLRYYDGTTVQDLPGIPPNPTIDEPEFTDGPATLATGPTILSGTQEPVLSPGVAAPRGSVYLNDNGAIYFKTGTPATAWESLANAFYNVRDFGAKGDGVTDDRLAIQAAIDAANTAGGGTVFVPTSSGAYLVTRASVGVFYALLLRANVRLLGESVNGSVIKLAPGTAASVRVLYAEASATRWGLDTLTIDGNKASQSVDEQRHGIFIDTNATDGYIVNCRFQNNTGDGVYHFQNVARIITQRCFFTGNDRNSLTLGSNNLDCEVLDCTFSNVAIQHIDSEPKIEPDASTGAPGDRVVGTLIQGNTFYTPTSGSFAITTAGPSNRYPNQRWRIIGNHFYDSSVEVIWIDDIVIQGNTWTITPAYTEPGLYLFRYSDRVSITGNTFNHTGNNRALYILAANDLDQPLRAVIQGNTFRGDDVTSLLELQGGRDLIVDGNTFQFVGDAANSGGGINARATLNVGAIQLSSNIFRRCAIGIRADSAAEDLLQRVSIDDNAFFADGVQGAQGIALDAAGSPYDDLRIGTNYFAPDFSFPVDSVNVALPTFVTAAGAWNPGTDQITIPGHGLSTDDGPYRLRTTGTLPLGDDFGSKAFYRGAYFVIVDDANTIRLATSHTDALGGTAANFTTSGTGTHTLTADGSLLHNFGGIGRDYLTQAGPFRLTTTGTLPAGLALATDYYWIRVAGEDDEWQLAATFADADVNEPVPVTITSVGTGTHTVTLAGINAAANQIVVGVQNLWALVGSAQANQGYPGVHTGLGVPTHTAANGTIYMRRDGAPGTTLYSRESGVWQAIPTVLGASVTGPVSSTDNALTRWDGVTGTVVQNSVVTLADDGTMTFPHLKGINSAGTTLRIDAGLNTSTFNETSIIFDQRLYPLISGAYDLGIDAVDWRGTYFNGQEKRAALTATGSVTTTATSSATLIYTGTGGHTFTLHAASDRTRFRFVHAGSGVLTIATSGGDTLNAVSGALSTMAAGQSQQLQKLGGTWYRVGGDAPSSRVFSVLDYGAVGIPLGVADNGSVNDTAALLAAYQACKAAGGGTVYYPGRRTYVMRDLPGIGASALVPPATANNLGSAANIELNAINIMFAGDGDGTSRLLMTGNGGDGGWYMFDVLGDANFLRWEGLLFDQDERKGAWPFNGVDDHPNYWSEDDPIAKLQPVSEKTLIHSGTTGQVGIHGVGDSIAANTPIGGTATLTDAAGLFLEEMAGPSSFIQIAGAPTATNNGVFTITNVPSATTIEYSNAVAVLEAAPGATWSILRTQSGRTIFNDPAGTFRAADLSRLLIVRAGNIRSFNRGTFQIGEVINEKRIVIRSSGETSPNDTFFSVGPVQTLTSASSAFDTTYIGAVVDISGTAVNVANRGRFVITGATATTLTYANAAGVAEGPVEAFLAVYPEEVGPLTYDVVDHENGYLTLNGTRAAPQTVPADIGRYVPAQLGPERQTQRMRPGFADSQVRMALRDPLNASVAGTMAFGVAWISDDDTEYAALEFDGAVFNAFFADANGARAAQLGLTQPGQDEWLIRQSFGATPTGTTVGTVSAITAAGAVLTSTQSLFLAAHVGAQLRIVGATNAANNGRFPITGFTNSNNITYTNASAVTEGAGAKYMVEGGTSLVEFLRIDFTTVSGFRVLSTQTLALFSRTKNFTPVLYQRALSAPLTGIGDTITAGAPATLTDLAGLFVASLVGAKIRIAGATNTDNNGLFSIVGFTGATIITFANPAAVTVTEAFVWEIVESANVQRFFYLDSALYQHDEQTHVLSFRHRTTTREQSEFEVAQCRFENIVGDGVRLVGSSPALPTRRVRVHDNVFIDCGRGALIIQRDTSDFVFTDNSIYGGTDQHIDFEPTGDTDGPIRWIIARNLLDNRRQASLGALVTLGGVSTFTRADEGLFADNLLLYGNIFGLDLGRVQIRGNSVIGNLLTMAPTLDLGGALVDVVIQDNMIRSTNMTAVSMVQIATRNNADPTRASILNNRLFHKANGAVISLENAYETVVAGNYIQYGAQGVSGSFPIVLFRVLTKAKYGQRNTVDANHFHGIITTGTATAARYSSTLGPDNSFPQIVFTNNRGGKFANGLVLEGANFDQVLPPTVFGNTLELTSALIDGLGNVNRIAIAGNAALGGLAVLHGTVDPLSVVPGRMGELYLRDTGASPYYNSTGAASGWVQLASRNAAQAFSGQQRASATALTDAATVSLDASANNIFDLLATVGVGATRAIGSPTNVVLNQQFLIRFKQDGTGGRQLTFHAVFDFGDVGTPSFTTDGANQTSIVSCHVVQTGPTVIAAVVAVQGLVTT